MINPFMGAPTPPSLIPQTMVNTGFYDQQPQQQQQNYNSQDYITQQLARMKQVSSPPNLQPGNRVPQSMDLQSVDPNNFQSYFDRLNSVDQIGKSMLGAEQAKAQYKHQQDLYNTLSQSVKQFQVPTLQTSPTGSYGSTGNSIPSNPNKNFSYAQQVAPDFGWGPSDMQAWYNLGMKESGWNNNAQNPHSSAYGIGQFLDSTWGGYGVPKTSDAYSQVLAMARYIQSRYGSPSAALAFHNSNNWY